MMICWPARVLKDGRIKVGWNSCQQKISSWFSAYRLPRLHVRAGFPFAEFHASQHPQVGNNCPPTSSLRAWNCIDLNMHLPYISHNDRADVFHTRGCPCRAFGMKKDAARETPGHEGMKKDAVRHDAALVDSSAVVHETAVIGPFTTVLAGVKIEEGAIIGSNCEIGPDVIVGRQVLIKSHVSISHCTLENNVVLWPGVRIGQDGFGFHPAPPTTKGAALGGGQVHKKPQELRVRIGAHVEIGANSTIDRGSWRDTCIGAHTKLDNMVHIAHNVVIGQNCLIAAQTAIAGSCTLGNVILIGGQVGIAQHLTIGDDAKIAGRSAVTRNLPAGAVYGGTPAVPIRQWHKQTIALRMLALNGSSMDGRQMMRSTRIKVADPHQSTRIKVAVSNNTSDAEQHGAP